MQLNRYTCRKVSYLLWDYAAYRLPESDWDSIERHLRDCARCRREMEQYRRAVRLVEVARTQPAPASETTWYALRAQLESAMDAAPSLAGSRRRARRYAGMAIIGGLVSAAIAVAILLPAHTTRPLDKKGSRQLPASQLPNAASSVLTALNTAFSRPLQVDEVPVPKTAGTMSLERNGSSTPHLSYTGYQPEITPHYSPNRGWYGKRRNDDNPTKIKRIHRQELQHNTPNLQYAVDGDRPSDTATQHYYVMDPLPSPNDQPRHYVMDMVNLSTATTTLASNVGGNKDQDIW